MNRAAFLLIMVLFAAAAAAPASGEPPPGEPNDIKEQSRPNVIFLLADDQRDNSFGAMGHPFVKTPNVDRLLRQSVRFGNTYVAEPTCSPSRTALLTGMHERVNGVGFTSSYQLTRQQWERTYPALLRKAGYYTGFIGKFGVEYGMGGKALLYDLASKIPCFVYDPALPADRRGLRRKELVSSLDITKTILDYAGVASPEFMTGESLRPLLQGKDVPWREELFLENLYTGRDTPFQEGVRFGKWKYIRMYDGKTGYDESDVDFSDRRPSFEMLFDLEADPGEVDNLVESQDHRDVLATLRRKCAAHSEALNRQRRALKSTVHVQDR